MCMGSGLCCGWLMLWVAAMYVQCTCCTEHGRYGLSCLHAETVESMSIASWVCMVCMIHMYMVCLICWSLSYVVKIYCCWTWQIWVNERL